MVAAIAADRVVVGGRGLEVVASHAYRPKKPRIRRHSTDSDVLFFPKRRRRFRLPVGKIVVGTILTAFFTSIVVAAVAVRLFTIPTPSMVPTLQVGATAVTIAPWASLNPTLSRGEVVVFTAPQSWGSLAGETVVKRVIGVEGDTITWGYPDGIVKVNDVPLIEPYVNREPATEEAAAAVIHSQTVGKKELFLLGDNRTVSDDSRFHGPVPSANVSGRVVASYAILHGFGAAASG